MTPEQSLAANFRQVLELPDDAVFWLLDLWHFIQVFDDYADGDAVDIEARDKAVYGVLALMPSNRFFQQHMHWLMPALSMMVLKWMASDLAEREGNADPRSFMWRAGYYDVVVLVTSLVHGPSSEKAYAALSLYGEPLKAYMEEFERD